ncbi:hypothetical protein TrVGV298_003827 [Trichoderma virens]|nr:hypothetical protein TrVGV298_003827 [Trichoderma virens]
MNRHALICQVQRLARSIIYILKNVATSITFEEIDMSSETTLRSDDYDTGTLLEVRPSGRQRVINATPAGPGQPLAGNQLNETDEEQQDEMEEEQQDETEEEEQQDETEEEQPRVANEKWLFVNGIATELFWLHLACKKLARQYSREITGVYNRGDGILWDLIECAGERNITGEGNARSQKRLIQRTSSSRGAQEKLKEQLEAALEQAGDGDGSVYKHVVVIAHSQGCLLLRLALEELVVEDAAGTGNTRQTMLERLCVFTFGNPSVDWKLDLPDDVVIAPLQNSGQSQMDLEFLSSHVLRTEHFANKVDFVAKLGVISEHRRADSGYAPEHVFVNEDPDWIGHLFGTQYSLDSRYYRAEQTNGAIGDPSWLLTCRKKTSIRPARGEFSHTVAL